MPSFLDPVSIGLKKIANLKKFEAEKRELYYFSDSVMTIPAAADRDRRSIDLILSDACSNISVSRITHGSYEASIYAPLVDFIFSRSYRPKLMIFSINLHSFSPAWYARPQFQFIAEKKFLDLYTSSAEAWKRPFFVPLQNLGYFDRFWPSAREFQSTSVWFDEGKAGVVSDFSKAGVPSDFGMEDVSEEHLTNWLRLFYMVDVNRATGQMDALKRLAKSLSTEHQNAIFYLTPIDFDAGVHYLGTPFVKHLDSSVKKIQAILEPFGFSAIDLTKQVRMKDFALPPPKLPDERLGEVGRRLIVENLVPEVERILKLKCVSTH